LLIIDVIPYMGTIRTGDSHANRPVSFSVPSQSALPVVSRRRGDGFAPAAEKSHVRQEPHAALPDAGLRIRQLRLWNALIRALARAHRWQRLLEEGRYRSAAEIAEAEGVTLSFVNRLWLTLLAPDIVEGSWRGGSPKGCSYLARSMPSAWEDSPPMIKSFGLGVNRQEKR
jgi:hypothetical protein